MTDAFRRMRKDTNVRIAHAQLQAQQIALAKVATALLPQLRDLHRRTTALKDLEVLDRLITTAGRVDDALVNLDDALAKRNMR